MSFNYQSLDKKSSESFSIILRPNEACLSDKIQLIFHSDRTQMLVLCSIVPLCALFVFQSFSEAIFSLLRCYYSFAKHLAHSQTGSELHCYVCNCGKGSGFSDATSHMIFQAFFFFGLYANQLHKQQFKREGVMKSLQKSAPFAPT